MAIQPPRQTNAVWKVFWNPSVDKCVYETRFFFYAAMYPFQNVLLVLVSPFVNICKLVPAVLKMCHFCTRICSVRMEQPISVTGQ
jgi:hypothetical protein